MAHITPSEKLFFQKVFNCYLSSYVFNSTTDKIHIRSIKPSICIHIYKFESHYTINVITYKKNILERYEDLDSSLDYVSYILSLLS